MRIINVVPEMDQLQLGKQGENKSTKFLFDVSDWLEKYPGCTITLVNRRPNENSSYPCVLTTEEDGRRGWVINSADLAIDGKGECELKCTLGDMIEKDKRTWKTKIKKSLSGDGDAPAPWESLVDDIEALVGDAQDAAEDAEAAKEAAEEAASIAAHAPIIQDGYWYEWDATTEQYVNTEVKAQGEDGDPGQDATPALITKDYSELTFPVAAGTLCYHSGLLYKANQAIATSEEWTAAHWTQTTIEAEHCALKTEINVLQPSASASDVGKMLKVKTVADGKVTEYEFGEGGGSGGTSDYTDLTNKPQINGVTLSGDKTASQLGLLSAQGIADAVADWCEENITDDPTVVIDSSLSVTGAAAEAKTTGDLLNMLVEEKTTKDYISEPSIVDTVKEIDASGNIVGSQYTNLKIWGFAIDGTKTGIAFRVIRGTAKYIAFYSANSYAQCSSTTFISKVEYTNDVTNEVDFPEGANYCLINYRTFNSGYLYLKEKVTVSSQEVNSLKDEMNVAYGDKMSFADLATFSRGKVNSNGNIDTNVLYRCVNATILDINRTIHYSFDNTTYNVGVYYYDADGNMLENNGWLDTFDATTIFEGSHVRIVIGKRDSTVALTDAELISLPKAVTFTTEIKEWRDTVNDNCGYESMCAKMFEKGGSPKSFSNALGIIVAGQSNIDGRVPKANLPASIVPPFENIKNNINLTNGTFRSSMTLPTNFGIDFSMYSALNGLNQNVYIIKRSEGGTSIDPSGTGTDKWTPWYEELDSISKSLLYKFETQIRKCIEDNPNTFDVKAFVWQQGEGDYATDTSGSKKASINYYKNFKCLVAYVRGIVGNERLPVVCGTVSHNSGQYDPRVEEATLKVASEDPYMICIDMSGATLLDSYHFDADSAVYFGYKAFDALIDLGVVTGTKINPVCPWEE